MGIVGRLVISAATAAVACVGVAVQPAIAAASPETATVSVHPVSRCATSHLRAVARVTGAAGGMTQVTLKVTNIGGRCTLTGYGHYRLLGRNGQAVPTHATRGDNDLGADPGGHRVLLAHAASAYAVIGYYQPNVPGSPQPRDYMHLLRFTPPSAVHSLTVSLTIDPDHGHLYVFGLVHGGSRPWARSR